MKYTGLDVCCKYPYQRMFCPFFCLPLPSLCSHWFKETFPFPFTLTCFRLPFSTCMDFFFFFIVLLFFLSPLQINTLLSLSWLETLQRQSRSHWCLLARALGSSHTAKWLWFLPHLFFETYSFYWNAATKYMYPSGPFTQRYAGTSCAIGKYPRWLMYQTIHALIVSHHTTNMVSVFVDLLAWRINSSKYLKFYTVLSIIRPHVRHA